MAPQVWAAKNCLTIGIDAGGYKTECDDTSYLRAVNEALPTFLDAFNLNPASLPTRLTGYVAEGIYSKKQSSVAGSDYRFGLTKGLEKMGTGLTTTPDNTFYDTSVVRKNSATKYTVEKESLLPTYNMGFALDPWDRKSRAFRYFPQAGYSARINPNRGTVGHSFGVSWGLGIFSFGGSYVQEPRTTQVAKERSLSLNGGLSFAMLSFDFSVLETRYSYTGLNSSGKAQQMYATVALHYGKLQGTYSMKRVSNLQGHTDALWMMALQYNLSARLRTLAFYNYVPGGLSVGLQWLL